MKREEKWNNYYELLVEYKNKYGNVDVLRGYEVDGMKLGYWVAYQRLAYRNKGNHKITQEQIELLNNLGIKWEMRNNLSWNDYYELLVEYKNKYGNVDVNKNYEVDGIKLGYWLSNQRVAYRNNSNRVITQEQVELLNNLGINWGSSIDERWDKYYSLLVKYKEEFGNINVPNNYKIDDLSLGAWVATQRISYKSNNRSISKERIELLNNLGMNWEIQDYKWNYHYELLKKYKEEHGNIDVPQKYVVDGIKLGSWVSLQRLMYRNYKDQSMTKEHIDLLNELGMIWQKRSAMPWDNYYELLKKYKEEHGNTDVTQRCIVNGKNLGLWLTNQRELYNNDKLSDERRKKLNEINIDWSVRDTKLLNESPINENYKIVLYKRLNNILKDLQLDGINEINSKEEQKELEKIMIKRIFR